MSVSRRVCSAWVLGLVVLMLLSGCSQARAGRPPHRRPRASAGVPVVRRAVRHPRQVARPRRRAAAPARRRHPPVGLRCRLAPDRAARRASSTGRRWTGRSRRPRRWAPRTSCGCTATPRSGPRKTRRRPGSTARARPRRPTRTRTWRILRQVAQRYRGRITSYQVWNEANIKIFYRGHAAYLAELTERAQEVLREVDPDALWSGPARRCAERARSSPGTASTPRRWPSADWPVDAMSVHLYPLADQGVGTRAAYIRMIRPWLAERGWTGPVWDTEVNFGDRRDFAAARRRAAGDAPPAGWRGPTSTASRWASTASTGTRGTTTPWASTRSTRQTGEILPAGQAFLTVQEWLDRGVLAGLHGRADGPDRRAGGADHLLPDHLGRPPGANPVQPRGGHHHPHAGGSPLSVPPRRIVRGRLRPVPAGGHPAHPRSLLTRNASGRGIAGAGLWLG